MPSFTNLFGGSTIQPSQSAYRALSLAASVALVWPPNSQSATDYVARVMDVSQTQAGFTITMPPANQVSPGYDTLFTNVGAYSYSVLDSSGATLVTILPGQQVYLYVIDNSTTAGLWRSMLFGSTSSSLSAATVQGPGVQAIGAMLNATHPVGSISSSTSVQATDRAAVFLWTGGVGTLTLPTAASVTNGFFFEVRNQGSGILTIQPQASEFVDTLANIGLQPNESCFIHSASASNWYTVGRGRSTQFNFTQLNKTVTGGSVTLTTIEASSVVQKYTGALVSNQVVVLPAVVQVYYVSNQTSGSFTLTFQSPGAGSTVTVPSSQNAILFCDGVNVINASTTSAGAASLSIAQGSATAPSLNVSGNSNTGIFQPITNTLSVTAGGAEVARFTATGINSTAIGATTPSTGSFTTISASGAITGNLTGNVTGNVSGGLTGNVTGSVSGSSASITGVNPIANGGTGATTVAGALLALGAAPLASPAFTGNPTAPTVATADSSTTVATTAFVKAAVVAGQSGVGSFNGRAGAVTLAAADVTGVGGIVGTATVAQGGTGVATLTGLAYGNGTLAFSAATAAQIVAGIGATVVQNATTAVNVSGVVAVANGGTGVATLTGIPYGNAAAAFSAATAAQIVSAIGATAVANATNAATATNSTQLNGQSASFYQTALGFNPVQQGTGIGQLTNAVKIGWGGSSIKATVDATDIGAFAMQAQTNTFTGASNIFNTGLTVGDASAQHILTVNGIASGTAGGSSLFIQQGGITNFAVGNYSSIIGGAYNATQILYSQGPLATFINGTEYFRVAAGSITVTNSTTNLSASGSPLVVNSTSATGIKVVMQDSGVSRGYLYADATYCGGWVNAANNLITVKSDNSGNLSANGNITANSDERLKKNWRDLPTDLIDRLAGIKHGIYDRKDIEATQVGVSAQSLQTLMPEAVQTGLDGTLSVAYGNAALVAVIELTKRVLELEAKLEAL